MLWFNQHFTRSGLIIGGLLVLAGCGFRPLYNQPAATGENSGYNVQVDLATVYVSPIKDRIGQLLRNLLLTRLNPAGEPDRAVYVLRVSLRETTQELGVRKSSVATRANLRLTANYVLNSADTKTGVQNEQLPGGAVLAISSYDISASEFTTLAARKDARARAVREIADDLKTRLAVYFAQNRK